jgi:hypothetical protein
VEAVERHDRHGSLQPGAGITKPVANYSLVGTRQPRIDIPGKVTGHYAYTHTIRSWHAPRTLVRPRGQGPWLTDGFMAKTTTSIALPEPTPRDGDFVGVVPRRSTTRSRLPRS